MINKLVNQFTLIIAYERSNTTFPRCWIHRGFEQLKWPSGSFKVIGNHVVYFFFYVFLFLVTRARLSWSHSAFRSTLDCCIVMQTRDTFLVRTVFLSLQVFIDSLWRVFSRCGDRNSPRCSSTLPGGGTVSLKQSPTAEGYQSKDSPPGESLANQREWIVLVDVLDRICFILSVTVVVVAILIFFPRWRWHISLEKVDYLHYSILYVQLIYRYVKGRKKHTHTQRSTKSIQTKAVYCLLQIQLAK